MKRIIALVLLIMTIMSFSSCEILNSEKNSIDKTKNTVIGIYEALAENFKLRKKTGYELYGIKLTVNSENVGTFTYVYTDKRPDELKYSDILVVEVNNRSGKIEHFSEPDYEKYEAEPYNMIKGAVPLDPSSFAVDSDVAIKNAATAHKGETFSYNYTQIYVTYDNGRPVYKVDLISLVNNLVYKTDVDAMTGTVIASSVEDLL